MWWNTKFRGADRAIAQQHLKSVVAWVQVSQEVKMGVGRISAPRAVVGCFRCICKIRRDRDRDRNDGTVSSRLTPVGDVLVRV